MVLKTKLYNILGLIVVTCPLTLTIFNIINFVLGIVLCIVLFIIFMVIIDRRCKKEYAKRIKELYDE